MPENELTDSDKINQLRALAQQYKAESQKYINRNPVLILPDGMDSFPGFRVTKNADGKNVVLPGGDPQFVRCMRGAWESLGVASGAGLVAGELPGLLIGVGAGGLQAISDARVCAGDNADRIFDGLAELEANNQAKGIAIEMGTFRKELAGVGGEVDDVRGEVRALQVSLQQEMRKSLADLMAKVVTQEDVERIVSKGISQISDTTRKHFAELRDHQIALEKANQLRADIQLTQQGLTAFVSIAFHSNPALANAINRGINGAAQLAQIGIALAAGPTPFGAVMLSLSAMGVINSMFGGGGGGTSFSQAVMESVNGLRKDIGQMRDEMHARFDAIERSLAVLADYMRNGFIVVDGKLNSIRATLDEMRDEQDIRARIEESTLTYLLSGQFNISAQRCLEGDASRSLDRHDFGTCLADFKLYCTDVARLDMIAGSGRIAPDPLGTVSTKFYLTVDTGRSLGYFSALDRAIASTPAEAEAPSPLEWVRGVEAYLKLMNRYDELAKVHAEAPKVDIIGNEQNNIQSMIKAGEDIKAKARYLRHDGAIVLLGLYGVEIRKWMQGFAASVAEELSKRQLGVAGEQTFRREWVEQTRDSSSWFRPCGEVSREIVGTDPIVAAAADRVRFAVGTRCWPDAFTNKDNDTPLKETGKAFVHNQPETEFGIQLVMPREEAVTRLQTAYVQRQNVSKYTDQVREMLKLALDAALKSDASQKAMARLGYLRDLLVQQVVIGLDEKSDPELKEKIQLVLSLAVDTLHIREILSKMSFQSERPLVAMFSDEANRLFDAEQSRVSDALKAMPATDSFPFIEPSLIRLRKLVIQPG